MKEDKFLFMDKLPIISLFGLVNKIELGDYILKCRSRRNELKKQLQKERIINLSLTEQWDERQGKK